MSVTEIWCDWFESLAPAVAQELGVALMRLCPGTVLEPSLFTANPTDGFVPRVKRLAAKDPIADAGMALTLSALTDYAFLDRGSSDSWDKNREMLEVLDQMQMQLGGGGEQLSGWIDEHKMRHPLRSRQWVKEAARWREVREGALAPAEISRASFAAMTSPPQ